MGNESSFAEASVDEKMGNGGGNGLVIHLILAVGPISKIKWIRTGILPWAQFLYPKAKRAEMWAEKWEMGEKMLAEFNFQKEELYRDILNFVNLVYEYSKKYSKEEIYGLVSQFRRASSSILLNITEGWGRYNNREKVQFYKIARSSLMECVAIMDISKVQGYLSEERYSELIKLSSEYSKRINGLIKSLEKQELQK